MPGFLDPVWLLALAIIPLIRWLHRWQAPMSAWPVSALFLWHSAAASDAPGNNKSKPDPAWLRRAFAVALLVIALTNPYWKSETHALTVWIDDSLSMFTQETGRTRLDRLLQTLAEELDGNAFSYSEVEVRSLSDPGQAQRYVSSAIQDHAGWKKARPTEPTGPPPSLMAQQSHHWLLSDGASESVRSWGKLSNLERVLQLGTATENSTVTRLAARRSLDDKDTLDVLVAISNTGFAIDTRELELRSEQQLLQATALSLSPGETMHWQTSIAAATPSLTASLSPADSLELDDNLNLSLDAFRPLITLVDNACAPALRRALVAHPALQIAAATEHAAALHVSCTRDQFANRPSAINSALIRVSLAPSRPIDTTPAWTMNNSLQHDFMLSGNGLAASPWPDNALAGKYRTVFAAGDLPLVVVHEAGTGTSVDTIIDMNHPLFIHEPEYAAFVSVLVDLATQRRLLDETASTSRSIQASTIAPAAIEARSNDRAIVAQTSVTPLSTAFLIGALLLLALDAALLLRNQRGARLA